MISEPQTTPVTESPTTSAYNYTTGLVTEGMFSVQVSNVQTVTTKSINVGTTPPPNIGLIIG